MASTNPITVLATDVALSPEISIRHQPLHHLSLDPLAHTLLRPTKTKTVFLALAAGLVIGHSTIEPVAKNAPEWEDVKEGEVTAALASGRLCRSHFLIVPPVL